MNATSSTTVFHAPGSCSGVTLNALEELGIAYEDRPIDIFKGAQRAPDYLAVDPKGKVPALLIDGALLTETPAIIWQLATQHPAAKLLPATEGKPILAGLIDLVWVSNTLHVLARTIRLPMRATTGDPAGVRMAAEAQMVPILAQIDARLAGSDWWYGTDWSIVDVYLAWVTGMLSGASMDLAAYRHVTDHAERVRARPSFIRARARERAAMERIGMELPGGAKL